MSDGKSTTKKKKKYASTDSPTIEAIVAGYFRFADETQAFARLETVRDTFIISRLPEGETPPPPDAVRLWIRGFDVTPEEKEQGYTGNYALLRVRNTNSGKYTITANKLPVERKYHPQRKCTKSRHPNWGHPILRAIKKKKIYKSLDETQAEILRLHEEYPEVTIPCTGKMYVMIYQRPPDKKASPVQKWVFEVKAADEGGFYFDYQPNTYSAPKNKNNNKKKVAVKDDTAALQNQPDGYFTSMLQLKRARKHKKAPLAAAAMASTANSGNGEDSTEVQ